MSIRQGRSTESRFAGTLRGRPIADWLELMAQTDDAWIYAHGGRPRKDVPKKPPVSEGQWKAYGDWSEERAPRVQRMMAAAAIWRRYAR
jgi:hypothetical protein